MDIDSEDAYSDEMTRAEKQRERAAIPRERVARWRETAERADTVISARPDGPCEIPELIAQVDSGDDDVSALVLCWAHNL